MTSTLTSVEQLLTDEMLARFDERAPQYDRSNTVLHRGLRGTPDERLPARFGTARVRRARTQPRRDQPPATAHRLRRPGDGRRRQHAPLLRRAVRRPPSRRRPVWRLGAEQSCRRARVRCRPRRGRQRHPRTPLVGEGRTGRRAGGSSPVTRSSAASRRCGRISGSTAWTRATRPTRKSSTPSCTVTPRTTASRRPGTRSACGRRCPTTRFSIARSSRTRRQRWCALPGSPAPDCSTSPCSPGRCSGSLPCIRRSPAGPTTRLCRRCTIARP